MMRIFLFVHEWAFSMIATSSHAQQRMDQEYADKIAEFTTDDRFVNEWVDHLPESATVPSPYSISGKQECRRENNPSRLILRASSSDWLARNL
ncbi:MAG: hypothetical protein BMS9Abin05_0068 [Rhodothermia bacterium]|nr:MAG: hypothetical protein BMS9Abin05_0068 [Rhodothermia bacterium]